MQQGLDRGLDDDPGRVLGRADVPARAPGQVGPVAAERALRGRGGALGGRVGVGRGQAEHQHVAGADVLAAEHGVAGGPAAGEVLRRRVSPEHLLQRVGDGEPPAGQGGPEAPVGEQQPQGVADPVDAGLVARDHQHHQVVHRLLVGQRGRVGEQPGGEVGAGGGAAVPDQFGQGPLELPGGAHRFGPAVDEVADQLDHPRPAAGGQADQLGGDQQRQRAGVLADQVGGAVRAPAVDQSVGGGLGGLAQLPVVDLGQGVRDGGAQPLVLGAVEVEQGGPPGGHRLQPRVGGQPALGGDPPVPGVLGEQRLVAGEFEQFAVAEDQPRLHPGLQLDRRHRAVPLAQPGVQAVRVVGDGLPVQRGQRDACGEPAAVRGRAAAVRGAVRDRAAAGRPRGLGRGHGCSSRSELRCRWSTKSISRS